MHEPHARPEGPGSPAQGEALDALRAEVKALREDVRETLPEAVARRVTETQARREAVASAAGKPPLLRVEDVARRLDVSARTVERLVSDGELRPLWIKGQRRFTPAAVDAYLRNAARTKRPSTKRPSARGAAG